MGRGRSCSQAKSIASTWQLMGCSAPRALHSWKAWLWAERGCEGSATPMPYCDQGPGRGRAGSRARTWQGGRPRGRSRQLQVGAQGAGDAGDRASCPTLLPRLSFLALLTQLQTPTWSPSMAPRYWQDMPSGRSKPSASDPCPLTSSPCLPLSSPASGPLHRRSPRVLAVFLLAGLLPLSPFLLEARRGYCFPGLG